jgi:hypothetical protein
MKRKSKIVLAITWDDENTDSPEEWDYRTMLSGDPFTPQGTHEVRLISHEELNGS